MLARADCQRQPVENTAATQHDRRVIDFEQRRVRVRASGSGEYRTAPVICALAERYSGDPGGRLAFALLFGRAEEMNMKAWKEQLYQKQEGAIGYMLLWFMGVPASVLFAIFVLRGCH